MVYRADWIAEGRVFICFIMVFLLFIFITIIIGVDDGEGGSRRRRGEMGDE